MDETGLFIVLATVFQVTKWLLMSNLPDIIQVAIIYNLPRDVRDISVQIFDKYLLQSIEKYPEVIYGGTTIPITAACCLLIGSKVNASRTVLSTVFA